MGCAAPFSNSSVALVWPRYSQLTLNHIIPHLSGHSHLLSKEERDRFTTNVLAYPQQYHLSLPDQLVIGEGVQGPVLQKWRIILCGLDHHIEAYCNCLDYTLDTVFTANTPSTLPFDRTKPIDDISLLPHPLFDQIEKDLDRTFSTLQLQRSSQALQLNQASFGRVLKRIANHFPHIGYTQGMNFFVGYLMILGYSQIDTFWMFTHMALNRRYLLLGLYEDDFPLLSVYSSIFKRMLKRVSLGLYEHLYETLKLDDALWVFKWFITYYRYSFPTEMCKYVWDYVIQVGGLGIVRIAIAITVKLKDTLLDKQDFSEVSLFFDSLKDVKQLNQHLNIKEVVNFAYDTDLKGTDYEGLTECNGGFYAEYYGALNSESNETKEGAQPLMSETLLEKWYRDRIEKRLVFREKHKKKAEQRTETEVKNANELASTGSPGTQKTDQNEDLQEDSVPDQLHKRYSDQCMGLRKKRPTYHAQQIYEQNGEDQSASQGSSHHRNCFKDQLDKIAGMQAKNYIHKDSKMHKMPPYPLKINNFAIGGPKTRLAYIGQQIMCNISLSGGESQSSSSKDVWDHPPASNQQARRNGGSTKIKTQEVRSINDLSQKQSLELDKNTDSLENLSHYEGTLRHIQREDSMANGTVGRVNFMISSQGPRFVEPNLTDPMIDIEMLNGEQLFKKQKRNTIKKESGFNISKGIQIAQTNTPLKKENERKEECLQKGQNIEEFCDIESVRGE